MRGATQSGGNWISMSSVFNPHSPCGERPGNISGWGMISTIFNPHSPCGERHGNGYRQTQIRGFQSTLPMRGATVCRVAILVQSWIFQSTLPMRGATLVDSTLCNQVIFQSTLPMRGATPSVWSISTTIRFSIHTPHAGSDDAFFGGEK